MDRLEPIWEDAYGLAVSKPPGLLTQPRGPNDVGWNLEKVIRHYLRPEDPDRVYLGTVHRLDRPVSGVILWAKNPKAAHRWSVEFANRRPQKEYWALVAPTADATTTPAPPRVEVWDDWIFPPDQSGRARIIGTAAVGAVNAVTEVEPGPTLVGPAAQSGWIWLRLRPRTGRTHQLRAQTAARGWPIVGDSLYGSTVPFGAGIALHARSLRIQHPILRTSLEFEAPPPPAWLGLLPRA